MKQALTLLMALLLLQDAHPQDSIHFKKKTFKLKIIPSHQGMLTGYLYKLTDTSIAYIDQPLYFNPHATFYNNATTLNYQNIEVIKIRRKGSTVRGLITGALIGLGTGVAWGLIEGDDKGVNDPASFCIFCMTAGEKAVAYGATAGTLGGIIGTIFGALARQRFTIGGNKKNFDKMRLSMMQRIRSLRPD